MALIKCPECQTEVSERATACPKCAHPLGGRGPDDVATAPAAMPASAAKPTQTVSVKRIGVVLGLIVGLPVLIIGTVAYVVTAKSDADRARHEVERAAAPAKVSVEKLGCECAPGRRIIVACRVTNDATVPVSVELQASAKTGMLGAASTGTSYAARIEPGSSTIEKVETAFSGLTDCTAAAACACARGSVMVGY